MALDLERVHRTFTTLVDNRQPWDSLWSETARYYLPTSMNWNTASSTRISTTEMRGEKVFDDTPAWAAQRFASALLGMILNPTQKWLEFELYTEYQRVSFQAKQWLQELRDRCLYVLQCPEVGFYDSYHEHLMDYGIFGEAVMLVDRDPFTKMPRFIPYPLEQCYVGLGANRKPNMVFRKYEMSAQAIQEEFGDGDTPLPECVQKAIDKKQYLDKFSIVHGVFPRKHGVAGGFATNKPFASVYYLEDKKQLLRESGFDVFPFSVPRFMLFASEEHGQGPGTLSLANVKTLNAIIKTCLVSDQRKASPAYLAQRRGWIKPLRFTPNAINYYDGFDMDKALVPIGNEGDPQAGQDWIKMYQEQILRAFYLDRLIAAEKKAEVKEIEALLNEDERMRDLIPQLSRLHAESIAAIILNVVMYVKDEMEPPPPELAQQMVKLRYLSPLAKAQNMLELSNANRTIQQVILPAAQIDPVVAKTVNWHKFSTWALDKSGFPKDIQVSEEEFEAEKQAAAQQQQMATAMEGGMAASEMAKNFSQAQAAAPPPLGGFI
jgi:hypothetical protein